VVFLGVDPSGAHEAHAEHVAILEGIAAGDAEAASLAMSTHLVTRLDALRRRLDARSDLDSLV
jgi:DNA-binding GntR family transcriptional regulator